MVTGRTWRSCLHSYSWVDLLGRRSGGTDEVARLAYGYRSSSVTATQLVTAAELRVPPGVAAEEQAAISEIVRWRREHQPGGANAGSVFTNPDGDSAGRLIERAGLKGLSPRHGGGVGEARQFHSGRQGRPSRRRGGAHAPRAGGRPGAERCGAAGGGPPVGLRWRGDCGDAARTEGERHEPHDDQTAPARGAAAGQHGSPDFGPPHRRHPRAGPSTVSTSLLVLAHRYRAVGRRVVPGALVGALGPIGHRDRRHP